MRNWLPTLALLIIGSGLPGVAKGQIDFSTDPSGSPSVDNTSLDHTAAYVVEGVDVSIGFDTNADDVPDLDAGIEATGSNPPQEAFTNDTLGLLDTEALGIPESLDGWMLDGKMSGLPVERLVVTTSSTCGQIATAASGEIWDLDTFNGTEAFVVEAVDMNASVFTETSPIPVGLELDGRPWKFDFPSVPDGIDFIRFRYVGTKVGAGFAYDNFDFTIEPGPEASVETIDFSTFPDTTPSVDNTLLDRTEAYLVSGVSVSMGFDDDGDDVPDLDAGIEAVGANGPTEGFTNDTLALLDTEAIGIPESLDGWFLRGSMGNPMFNPNVFVMSFSSTCGQNVFAVSGEIWDIDTFNGTEAFLVEGLNAAGVAIVSENSPVPAGLELDGKPWQFNLSSPTEPIAKVRISFVGTKIGTGFAIDNFAITVPEPSSNTLLLPGIALLHGIAARRRALRAFDDGSRSRSHPRAR